MRIRTAADGRLRVLISHQELAHFNIDFHTLKRQDAHAQKVIRRILQLVCTKKGICTNTTLTVQALPSAAGCILYITPTIAPLPNDGIYIFAPSLAALPKLKEICRRAAKDCIMATALYAYGDGYRLLLYAPHLSAIQLALLSEHAVPAGGGKLIAAHIAEHGKALFDSQCV